MIRSARLAALLTAALGTSAGAVAPATTELLNSHNISTAGANTGATADAGVAAEPARREIKAAAALAAGLLVAGAIVYVYRRP